MACEWCLLTDDLKPLVILFFVLTKFAWGPILKGLQDREQKIKDDLQRAQTAAHEAAASLEKYQNQLADSQAEVARIIDRGRSDAQKIATTLKEHRCGHY